MQLKIRSARRGDGLWVQRDPHVPALVMFFFPPQRRSSSSGEAPGIVKASFFTDRAAEDSYFRAALRIVKTIYPSPPWRLDQFVEQHRNVVVEWNSYIHPDYSRVVLDCLAP